MWIKASEQKPDTSRRVLVRGYNYHGDAMIAMAQWSDDDKRWINAIPITVVYSAYGPTPDYWMEIDDLFSLPIEDTAELDSKIDVPVSTESGRIVEKEYEVWQEGYQATVDRGTAEYLGKYVGTDFRAAVYNALKAKKWDMSFFDPIKLRYWGCRFFDNEADARKGYG